MRWRVTSLVSWRRSFHRPSSRGKQKKISEKRITRILEGIYQKAVSYRDERSLGVYTKARMGNTFRWELESLGYSKDFVKMATEGMVVYLTRH